MKEGIPQSENGSPSGAPFLAVRGVVRDPPTQGGRGNPLRTDLGM